MKNIKEILADIDVPVPARKIYVDLLEEGGATARTISLRTGITRTSIYDHIKTLRAKGLIVEKYVEGKTFFEAGDARQLSILLDDRIDKLHSQRSFLDQNLSALLEKSKAVQPKIRFFEGEEGVKQLLKDILWYDDITLQIYWPYEQMLDFLGKEFLLWFSQKRQAHNISLKTIWGRNSQKKGSHIFTEDDSDVERRYLVQKKLSPMSYLIYAEKVAFISSHKESFGFIVESAEFTSLMRMQFETLWDVAKKK